MAAAAIAAAAAAARIGAGVVAIPLAPGEHGIAESGVIGDGGASGSGVICGEGGGTPPIGSSGAHIRDDRASAPRLQPMACAYATSAAAYVAASLGGARRGW